MAYWWRVDPALDVLDAADVGADRRFEEQSEAEGWLTANYLELDAMGVRRVSLFEEGRLIYGPMSLES